MEGQKLGFIGAGMMASAMIKGIIAAKVVGPSAITASDCYQPMLDKIATEGVATTQSNAEVLAKSSVVILAVKPDMIAPVLTEAGTAVTNHLVISIAAGKTLATLETLLNCATTKTRVIRVMPNTPCLVGEAASAFAMGTHATDADRQVVRALLEAVGVAVEVKEKDMDAVTAVSGSGPAYVYMMIEALADGGVRAGLPRATAQRLAAQTLRGAATMVLETGTHPGELKDAVCSPGGTTIAGVEALEQAGFRSAAMAAVAAATARSQELGK